jgi:hypothetical protein
MKELGPARGRRARLPAAALVLALAGCASMEAGSYRSDCISVTSGEIQIDCEGGTWSFGGVCARVRHSACPDIKRFVFQAGVDTNGNGTLEAGEKIIDVDDSTGGDDFCAGAADGSFAGRAGEKLIVHFEVYVKGQDTPAVSKTDRKNL